jgi:hypothetical protein
LSLTGPWCFFPALGVTSGSSELGGITIQLRESASLDVFPRRSIRELAVIGASAMGCYNPSSFSVSRRLSHRIFSGTDSAIAARNASMATSEPAARARSAACPIKRTRLKRFCLFSSGLPPRTRFAAGPATREISNACSAGMQRSPLPSFRQIRLTVASCSARDQASQPADFPVQHAPMSGSVNICGWPFCARTAPPVITTSANAAISFLKIASESNVRSQYYRFGPSSKASGLALAC